MAHDEAYLEAEKKIEKVMQSGAIELDLGSIELTELPGSLGKLTQLTKLNLSHNKLNTLPESLGQLTQLTELNLSSNKLTTLPESLGQLTQLTELNLSGNKLTTLPESLGQLTQLTELYLSHNKLTTLPNLLGQLSQLKVLNLSYNKLTKLPESLEQLSQLQLLDLSGNKLTSLSESLGQLSQLTELHLADNVLTRLPEAIGDLKLLSTLIINSNKLDVLHDGVGQLSNLVHLAIGGNNLTYLPPSIKRLTQIKNLYIWGNPLTGIPDWLFDLCNLETLNLSDLKIAQLPAEIIKLKKLENLFLSENYLSDISSSLAKLENLVDLNLNGNPLNPALQSAYDAGQDELIAYLRSLENAEPLYEAKLVLVGEGNAGKTTLLKALKGNKDEAPQKNEPTTHGVEIDIHGLLLPHPTKEKVKIQLNAWDFGGQDVYRVTHQFFFSRRSLYLLVWEPRRGVQAGQVEDWLNMIRIRVGNDARVLIVSSHCKTGERIARIDRPVLQRQYGDMIVGFYEVDSLVPDGQTGEMVGIAALKKIIAEQASKLEQMGMLFSPQWKAARDELIAHPEPRVSYTAFSDTCAKHELTPIATKTLAHLMHDLGYIVHYSDDERLRDDVVLQPQWLTKAIGFVLEDRVTAESEGILPDKHLYEVWHDHAFKDEPRYDPSIYPFFLRLMEKYDVSYRLPDGKASLVAQHVPQIRPELPWLPEQRPSENQRRIAMICAMEEDPTGLVPWMIVRTHDYAVEQNNTLGSIHRMHWQKGMFLSHPPHGQAMLEKRGLPAQSR